MQQGNGPEFDPDKYARAYIEWQEALNRFTRGAARLAKLSGKNQAYCEFGHD